MGKPDIQSNSVVKKKETVDMFADDLSSEVSVSSSQKDVHKVPKRGSDETKSSRDHGLVKDVIDKHNSEGVSDLMAQMKAFESECKKMETDSDGHRQPRVAITEDVVEKSIKKDKNLSSTASIVASYGTDDEEDS